MMRQEVVSDLWVLIFSLCFINVETSGFNAALGKNTLSSSGSFYTHKAVDGTTSTCVQTQDADITWFVVDMGALYTFYTVGVNNLSNNKHRLKNFSVRGYVTLPSIEDIVTEDLRSRYSFEECAYQSFEVGSIGILSIPCPQPITARYVALYKNFTDPADPDTRLHTCEITVDADYPVSRFNPAQGKPTLGSSIASGGESEQAVDGDLREWKCFVTRRGATHWFVVDLEDTYTFYAVTLLNRDDTAERLKYFSIRGYATLPDIAGIVETDLLNTHFEECVYSNQQLEVSEKKTFTCPVPITARFVAVYKNFSEPGDDKFQLCELQLEADYPPGRFNAAFRKKTYSSSVDSPYFAFQSLRAVDTDATSSCFVSQDTEINWLVVDLGHIYTFYSVTLTNRDTNGYRLKNLSIRGYITLPVNNDFSTEDFQFGYAYEECEYVFNKIPPKATEIFRCPVPINARFVALFKDSSDPGDADANLQLCDVKVEAELHCGDIPDPQGGGSDKSVTYSNVTHPLEAVYSCGTGYTSPDRLHKTCQRNGQWSEAREELSCFRNGTTTNKIKIVFAALEVDATRSQAALITALDQIKSADTSLSAYDFEIRYVDSGCNGKTAIGRIMNLLEEGYDFNLAVGPLCDSAIYSMGLLTSKLNVPTLGYNSFGDSVKDKSVYTTLIRGIYSSDSDVAAVISIVEKFSWKTLCIYSFDNGLSNSVAEDAKNQFNIKRVDVYWVRNINENGNVTEIREDLIKARRRCRVLLYMYPSYEYEYTRNWTVAVFEEDMHHGDYGFIWLFLGHGVDTRFNEFENWYDKNSTIQNDIVQFQNNALQEHNSTLQDENSTLQGQNDATENQTVLALKVLESVLLVKPTSFVGQSYTDLIYLIYFNFEDSPYRSSIPLPFVFFGNRACDLYELMRVYASVANDIIRDGGEPVDGEQVLNRTKNFVLNDTYYGIPLWWNDNGDRTQNYILLDFVENSSFSTIGSSNYYIKDDRLFLTYGFDQLPIWGDGSTNAPQDEPDCGFYGDKCLASELILLIIAVSSVFVVLCSALPISVAVKRYTQEIPVIKDWRINYKDVERLAVEAGKEVGEHADDHHEILLKMVNGTVAKYKDVLVAIKFINKKSIDVNKEQDIELKKLINLSHDNLNPFIGACIEPPNLCVLWDYAKKGSLHDIIENANIANLNEMLKFSITSDIWQGLQFLHTHFGCHGNIKSNNIILSSRWTAKLTDYNLPSLMQGQDPDQSPNMDHIYTSLYWTAPEILRSNVSRAGLENYASIQPINWTKSEAGDIYSVAVVLKELFCRSSPYEELQDVGYNPYEIMQRVHDDDGFRPSLVHMKALKDAEKKMIGVKILINNCWNPRPKKRPTAKEALAQCYKINPFKKNEILDRMIKNLEVYAKELEARVEAQTAVLRVEIEHSDNLLLQMLPRYVVNALKEGREVEAEEFTSATIFFSSIVGFTEISLERTPEQVVNLLNDVHSLMDGVIPEYDVYKVETVGDVYMLSSGLPERNGDLHISQMADCALSILSAVHGFKQIEIQIGIHTGAVGAGVIGTRVPKYCLFGDSTNTTHRVMSSGKPMKIHLSQQSHEALSEFPGYYMVFDAVRELKGKGLQHLYWLYGRDNYTGELPNQVELEKFKAQSVPKIKSETKSIDQIQSVPKIQSDTKSIDQTPSVPKIKSETKSVDQGATSEMTVL